MDKIVEVFEDLIRRNIAPSASFFVLLVSGNLFAAALVSGTPSPNTLIDMWIVALSFLYKAVPSVSILGAIFLVGLVGISYVLSTLSQVLYDNLLKQNLNGWRPFNKNNIHLDRYRERAGVKLASYSDYHTFFDINLSSIDTTPLKDYIFYEIIGGIDSTDTRRFVNDAKAYGIVFISLIIVIVQLCCTYWNALNIWEIVISFALILFFFLLGRETVKAQYRARALRLYVNFLAMPNAKITKILHDNGEQHGTSAA